MQANPPEPARGPALRITAPLIKGGRDLLRERAFKEAISQAVASNMGLEEVKAEFQNQQQILLSKLKPEDQATRRTYDQQAVGQNAESEFQKMIEQWDLANKDNEADDKKWDPDGKDAKEAKSKNGLSRRKDGGLNGSKNTKTAGKLMGRDWQRRNPGKAETFKIGSSGFTGKGLVGGLVGKLTPRMYHMKIAQGRIEANFGCVTDPPVNFKPSRKGSKMGMQRDFYFVSHKIHSTGRSVRTRDSREIMMIKGQVMRQHGSTAVEWANKEKEILEGTFERINKHEGMGPDHAALFMQGLSARQLSEIQTRANEPGATTNQQDMGRVARTEQAYRQGTGENAKPSVFVNRHGQLEAVRPTLKSGPLSLARDLDGNDKRGEGMAQHHMAQINDTDTPEQLVSHQKELFAMARPPTRTGFTRTSKFAEDLVGMEQFHRERMAEIDNKPDSFDKDAAKASLKESPEYQAFQTRAQALAQKSGNPTPDWADHDAPTPASQTPNPPSSARPSLPDTSDADALRISARPTTASGAGVGAGAGAGAGVGGTDGLDTDDGSLDESRSSTPSLGGGDHE